MTVWTLGWLAACAEYATPEEACPDSIPGERNATSAELELFGRVACYRRLAGLNRPSVDKFVSAATAAHANYLELNQIDLSDPFVDWTEETFGEFGFTGFGICERMLDAGWAIGTCPSYVWQVLTFLDEGQSYTEIVDGYIDNPFLRDVLLAPTWEGAGYAEFQARYASYDLPAAHMNIVLAYPSGSKVSFPVLYPADGQVGVPTSWENNLASGFDAVLDNVPAVTGYPITFTFGSGQVVNGFNPLSVGVGQSTISGPSGDVEHLILLPGDYSFGKNWSTAILIPTEPLQPNSTYTVTAVLSWIERQNVEITTSFTTGAGG